MPIPLLNPPAEEASEGTGPSLRLVVSPAARPAGGLWSRGTAHVIDLLLVQGCSLYGAKLFSLALVSFHMKAINGTGKSAERIFQDTWAYGTDQVSTALLLLVSVAYFIVWPHLRGRTFGMGLLGLRLENHYGDLPSLAAMGIRVFGVVLMYVTGGILLLPLLKGKSGPLFHDRLSGTRVVRGE